MQGPTITMHNQLGCTYLVPTKQTEVTPILLSPYIFFREPEAPSHICGKKKQVISVKLEPKDQL